MARAEYDKSRRYYILYPYTFNLYYFCLFNIQFFRRGTNAEIMAHAESVCVCVFFFDIIKNVIKKIPSLGNWNNRVAENKASDHRGERLRSESFAVGRAVFTLKLYIYVYRGRLQCKARAVAESFSVAHKDEGGFLLLGSRMRAARARLYLYIWPIIYSIKRLHDLHVSTTE